jgi:hypothetical protein
VTGEWTAQNLRRTALALRRVEAFLADGPDADVGEVEADIAALDAAMERPATLTLIREAFGLSAFETDVLVLCAGIELGEIKAATFELAMAALPGPHWSALTPQAPLRRWGLVEPGSGPHLRARPLHAAERVVHALAGVPYVDDATGLRAPASATELPPGQDDCAATAARCLSTPPGPLVQLVGRRRGTAHAVAAAAAARLGLSCGVLRADDVPQDAPGRSAAARLLEREAVLAGLLVAVDVLDADAGTTSAAARLVDELACPVVVLAAQPLPLGRDDVRLPVPDATAPERRAAWTAALGPAAVGLGAELDRAADLLDLDLEAIRAAATEYAARAGGTSFWALVRERARPRIDHLTDRVRPSAGWDELVLPPDRLAVVHDIAAQVRTRRTVHGDWGFGAGRGTGIAALFTGPSGTGKTMAAEVIAADLELDLYRTDLSAVVSKYIGETEKNLGTVFDEAEGAGAILLFDEADALFGRRSEVRDSHDRYANLEVSYLLQRMEAYNGLAILTTNQREAVDQAFLRRLRFAVAFPFPDAAARADIWRRIFPPTVPTAGLDPDRLAQLGVAGGTIRSIALNAAFHAAAGGGPVRMDHVLRAARAEFVKLDRPLPEAQVRGWT